MRRRPFLAMLAACVGTGAGVPAVRADAAEDVLWQRLRSGGHILLIRHAATDPGVGDPPGFRLGACATQRNLSERGRREARALGAALQAGGVTIGPVWSSRWCRCLDTGRLAFGRVEPAPMLDSMFNDDEAASRAKAEQTIARLAALKEMRNVALVTHDVNIRALAREAVVPGGIVVARMDGGKLAVLGQLLTGRQGGLESADGSLDVRGSFYPEPEEWNKSQGSPRKLPARGNNTSWPF
jgi:phosphohistidine phosphatase SixA